jgi:hypothetical protein
MALLLACSAKAPEPAGDVSHRVITGPLAPRLREILSHEDSLEDCDRTDLDSKLELAQALDERAEEIARFNSATPPVNLKFRRVEFGPTYLRERVVQDDAEGGPESWDNDPESWRQALADYRALRSQPVNADWAQLNIDVRSLLVDDEDRIVYGVNVYLDHESENGVLLAAEQFAPCAAAAECVAPTFTSEAETALNGNPYFVRTRLALADADAPSLKREWIARLKKLLDSAVRRYGFKANPDVRRVSESEFVLPVNSGVFAGVEGRMAEYIEHFWRTSDLKLRIEWVTRTDVYQVFLGQAAGERAFVDFGDRTIHFFPNNTNKTLAHEFGHVLGFRDHYFTRWRPETCAYDVQIDYRDLMSNSPTGVVTQAEWAKLRAAYPLR